MALIILASRSPRRRELLEEAGYSLEVRPPRESAECGICSGENAAQLVSRLAYQKAADVAGQVESGIVVGCDTVVECDGRVLGKPADELDAREMLNMLRGREHRVWSGLCLWKRPGGHPSVRVATTILRMDQISDHEIAEYLASGAWEGKAAPLDTKTAPAGSISAKGANPTSSDFRWSCSPKCSARSRRPRLPLLVRLPRSCPSGSLAAAP